VFVKLFRISERHHNNESRHYLTEISLNIGQISFMSENREYKSLLMEGKLGLDLRSDATFTNIRLSDSREIVVVGTPDLIQTKIWQAQALSSRKVLRD